MKDPFAYDPALDEALPSFFRFHFEEFTVGQTDNCYVPIAGTACTSSLRPDLSFPYNSGSTSWFDSLDNIESVVAKSANGIIYCEIYASDFDDPFALLGYKAIFLLSNDRVCYDRHFKCTVSGSFSYYELDDCKGNPTFSSSVSTQLSAESSVLGNITLKSTAFTNATMFYDWIQYSPTADLVPRFDLAWDYIGASLYAISMMLALYIPMHTCFRLWKKNQPLKLMHYVVVSGQACMFIWITTAMIYWLMIFVDNEGVAIFSEIRDLFFNIGTLLSSVSAGILLVTAVYNNERSDCFNFRKYFYITILFLVCVHIALNGTNYFEYYYNGGDNNVFYSGSPTTINSVTAWENLGYLWIVFLFAWNFSIPLVISWRCLTLKYDNLKSVQKFQMMLAADPQLPYLFAIQLFCHWVFLHFVHALQHILARK
ncbi:hypothetical protein HDV01_004208 [Terramyces sp. JEL0728]|nr:hypothetical protein HDV01_004208 [Terramyces sp. JEL0728]